MTQRRIYQCAFPYFITFTVLEREWIFDGKKKAEMLNEIILNAGDLKNHLIYQFAIMPDHVHILCHTESHRGLESPRCDRGPGFWNVGFLTRETKTKKPLCHCGIYHKYTISDFVKSIRGTFSRKMHKGKIWHPRFYDQVIANKERLRDTITYITHNPLKADLPQKYQNHPYQYINENLILDLF